MPNLEPRKLIGFIDLLGSKESSKISEHKFYSAIKRFLFRFTTRLGTLAPDSYTVQYLSDSAFFELEISPESFAFLRALRFDLFLEKIFFKCALIPGNLKPQNITEIFLRDLLREQQLGATSESFPIKQVARNFSGFFFSDLTIKAFLLHEEFKGIGFVVSPDLVSLAEKEFVRSMYYVSDTFKSARNFYDLSFSAEDEVASWSEDVESGEFTVPDEWNNSSAFISNFISAAEIAALKKGTFAKYYIPTLVSMARSTDYSTLNTIENSLGGTPQIYRMMISDSIARKRVGTLKGVFDAQCAVLDTALSQLQEKKNAATTVDDKQEIEDTINLICQEFVKVPRVRTNLQHAKSFVLSPVSKDILLEAIVK